MLFIPSGQSKFPTDIISLQLEKLPLLFLDIQPRGAARRFGRRRVNEERGEEMESRGQSGVN